MPPRRVEPDRLSDAALEATRAPIGCWAVDGGFAFRVWAPDATRVELLLEGPRARGELLLERAADGYHQLLAGGLAAGSLYRYRLDGQGPFPDPASRSQPLSVHGPSEAISQADFDWAADSWPQPVRERLSVYELHVGTATRTGTFDALIAKLPHFASLGVTALELMPVAGCPGKRNWGYDGVSPFAPAAGYGGPTALKRLLDAAHAVGLAVLLDVVFNHLGPDGNYLWVFARRMFTEARTPWGQAIDFGLRPVRDFFVWNALAWLHDYRFDGLRLDATHALARPGKPHILAELSSRVRVSLPPGREVLLVAEDSSNDARMTRSRGRGGLGLDAVWADDFHHQVHVAVTGQRDGYYADYGGRVQDLARTLRRGWFYEGQRSVFLGRARGTRAAGLAPAAFVHCLQNHDQVGNRALGDRLHHQVGLDVWRALSVLLLTSPYVPLLFMGQEWAASTPFQFFTDHEPGLGKRVTAGRLREFRRFREFRSPAGSGKIPDPQDRATFRRSKLRWAEKVRRPHAGILRLYRALLRLRARHPVMTGSATARPRCRPLGKHGLVLLRATREGRLLTVVNLRGRMAVDLRAAEVPKPPRGSAWRLLLATEDVCHGGVPGSVTFDEKTQRLRMEGPGALVLEAGVDNCR
ncbi:MAG: malto-oligosyltrehalose trehalohydrolase [Candidatus Riflebacteria bacterium]|nr:malto-oligosyltrehalose trehalohydrolase [Candidatus Riflebacteria bacterium]